MIAASMMDEILSCLDEAGDESARVRGLMLAQRMAQPWPWAVLVGETSSGKSTLLNALLGEPIMPVRAFPTTGTLVEVMPADPGGQSFHGIYSDATAESLTLEGFRQMAQEPPADLLRLQVRWSRGIAGGLEVFDTPGYNAENQAHEAILRSILPEADAIVFVAGYAQGFGQADQDLVETARESLAEDAEAPLFLAINRVPDGCPEDDPRIREIYRHAQDSLRGAPLCLHLVRESPGNPRTAEGLPDAGGLWRDVAGRVCTPARAAAVEAKLRAALAQAMEDALRMVDIRLDALRLTPGEREVLQEKLGHLKETRRLSLEAIDQAFRTLEETLPPMLERARSAVVADTRAEVNGSDKWNDADTCRTFVQHHLLEFRCRPHIAAMEGELAAVLDDLDNRLNELGNTAVADFRRPAHLPSAALKQILENAAITLGRRITGELALAGLKKLGGIGGEAAGLGNAIKMIISRAGKLFDKTFKRSLYTRIGKLFNKGTTKILAAGFAALLEVGLVLWEVYRWKDQLMKLVEKGMDGWKTETWKELSSEMLPAMRAFNVAGIEGWYDDLIATLEATLQPTEDAGTRHLESLRARLADLIGQWKNG